MTRYFIAGGGCYGSYYVRQLDRARALGKLGVQEIVVVDRNPNCALAEPIKSIKDARLEVCDWLDFGAEVIRNRAQWSGDQWVPTPIGPHIIFHWFKRHFKGKEVAYQGPLLPLPYAQTTPQGTLVLSHAPGLCPTNCVEPRLCPLTKGPRDWEMRETVQRLLATQGEPAGLETLATVVCQHHSHGVGTIPMAMIYSELSKLEVLFSQGKKRGAVATVSSCHGILDVFET